MVAIPLSDIEIGDIVELLVPLRTPTVLFSAGHTFRVADITMNQYLYNHDLLYHIQDIQNPSLSTTVGLGMIVKVNDLILIKNMTGPIGILN